MEQEELRALFQLRCLPGIGDVRLRWLLRRHGSARAALRAPATELGAAAAQARGSAGVLARVERACRLLADERVSLLREGDAAYPRRLGHLCDPPYLLFARGCLDLLDRAGVAVVGSRACSEYGAAAARDISRGLAEAGMVVISGLARGVDAVAHLCALQGGTIAVLGCGIDVVYPRQNGRLQERIAAGGLLLTEFIPGEPALAHNFPRRNRIIAALALGVVVVEAGLRSGALITVDHALDLGRDVFAVPGPIGVEGSRGTNRLIQEGAGLVTGAADIITELGSQAVPGDRVGHGAAGGVPRAKRSASGHGEGYGPLFDAAAGPAPLPLAAAVAGDPAAESGEAGRLLACIDLEPRHVNDVASACGLDCSAAMVTLLELELVGKVRQLAGMRFVRASAG